jgi:putative ABC transport system permease protein
MGLTRAAHLRSLLLELAVVAGLGFVIGGGVGAGAFRIIVASLDMYPDLPPGAAFSSPTGTWAITGAVWCAVVLLAAVGVQLLADRAKPAEILRLE